MNNQTNLEKLSEKVSSILQKYNTLKNENELLRNELMTLKAQREITNQEIEKLSKLNAEKDIEIDEIVNKIESMLS